MHLDDERVQRAIHGEVPEGEEATVQDHLASCPACTRMVQEAREEEDRILELLEELDHPLRETIRSGGMGNSPTPRPRRFRWAAGVIGVLGLSTAAYAAPGSPVPGWVQGVMERLAPSQTEPDLTSIATDEVPALTGIGVAPGSHLTVTFAASGWAGPLTISVEEVPEVAVEAVGVGAVFTSDAGVLLVEPEGVSGEFRIRIPSDAPWVDVRLGEESLFEKRGEVLDTNATRDEEGRFRIDLPQGPRRD